MKKISMTLAAVFAASSFAAVAAPMQMTDAEMEKVVAGKTLYVWTNMDGDTFVTSKEFKAPGGKLGWVGDTYFASCNTGTLQCTDSGSIADVQDPNTLKFNWVYTAPPPPPQP